MQDKAKEARWILFTLWLLIFAASSQIMIMAPILPRIGEQLAIPAAIQGTLITAYAVMVAIFALIAGPISDRLGRQRIMLLGTAALAITLALHGLADDYASLLTVRALSGAAGGILSGAVVAYVGDYFPPERRGWANGWVMSGAAIGQVIGIPLGAFLAELYGFRLPFILFAITTAAAAVLIWRVVPQPPIPRLSHRLSVRSALQDYWRLLRQPATAAASVAFFLMFMSVSVYVTYLPTWLEASFHVNGTAIASLFFVGGIANAVTGPQAGKLSDRIGRKGLVVVSSIALALVMLLTTVLVQQFWMAYVLFVVSMIFVASRISPFQALVTEIVPDEQRGTLMSLTVALGQAGFGLGGMVAGPTYADFGYISNTVLGAACVLGMAVLIAWFIPEPRPLKPPITELAGQPAYEYLPQQQRAGSEYEPHVATEKLGRERTTCQSTDPSIKT